MPLSTLSRWAAFIVRGNVRVQREPPTFCRKTNNGESVKLLNMHLKSVRRLNENLNYLSKCTDRENQLIKYTLING